MLCVSALVTCAGLSAGNCARMSATMPATTALAAAVLLSRAYPVGPLAAMTPSPAAVSVTYGWWLLNEALVNCRVEGADRDDARVGGREVHRVGTGAVVPGGRDQHDVVGQGVGDRRRSAALPPAPGAPRP